MAGEWIKMRNDLHTHPKVVRMSSALKADRLRVIGGLHAVWCLFDVHSEDGSLSGYTPQAVDELISFAGFSDAMSAVKWLNIDGDGLTLPEFDEHNGQSAKRRATETKRKRLERDGVEPKTTGRKTSASDADKKRSRGEERREEKNSSSLRSEEGARPTSGEVCKAMKSVGLQSVNPSHPKLQALIDAGITLPEFTDAAKHAFDNQKPFAYALATAEGRRRDAAVAPLPVAGLNKQEALEASNAAVVERFLRKDQSVTH